MQKQDVKVPVADNHSIQAQPEQNVAATKPVDTIQQQAQPQQQIAATQTTTKKENKISAETAIVKKKKGSTINSNVRKNENDEAHQIVRDHTVIEHNSIAQEQKEPPITTHDIAVVPENFSKNQNEVAALQTPAINTQTQGDYKIYPVAYKEINTNDDDRSLHVGMFDLNKTKVKNLFK